MNSFIDLNGLEFGRIFLIVLLSIISFLIVIAVILKVAEVFNNLIIKLYDKYFVEYEYKSIFAKILNKRKRSYITIRYGWRVLVPEEKTAYEVYVHYDGKKEWIDIEDYYEHVNVGDEVNATLVIAKNKKGKFISNKVLIN